jgi:hypothetical protein
LKRENKDALIGAGVGAGGGIAYSYGRSSLPRDKKEFRVSSVDREKFISKLKPGDVLLTGAYDKGPWEKGFNTFLNHNKPVYHVGVYTGKKQFSELILPNQEPSHDTVKKDIHFALKEDAHEAWRPIITDVERKRFIRGVQKRFTTSSYSSPAAIKAYAARAVGLKNVSCVGDFCSNAPAKHLPKRLFNVDRSMAMPKDYTNPKHFKFIAELKKVETHLPASNKSLMKYVAAPALALGALGFALGHADRKKE